MRRYVDLSICIENEIISDPPFAIPEITYMDHSQTIGRMQHFFPELEPGNLPEEAAWAIERIKLTTHNGTHMDAPYHFHPTMNHDLVEGGEPAATIDEIPLDWCYRPGVKLDFRHLPDGYVVTAQDVEEELARIDWQLSPFDIVLVNTRAGSRYGHDDYLKVGCGMGRDATLYLLERGVRITGIDAWSWDVPFQYTSERVEQSGDYSLVWEGHKAGRERAYCHMEKLHNLEALPSSGFQVVCFPIKIKKASAGWTRAVAILND